MSRSFLMSRYLYNLMRTSGAGLLYRLDFSSGKSYVRATTRAPWQRLKEHVQNASMGKKWPLYHAWREFGKPRFVPLALVARATLPLLEARAVEVFGTRVPEGYNLLPGGKASPSSRPEVKARRSRRWKRNNPMHCPEIAALFRGEGNPMRRPEVAAKMVATKLANRRRKLCIS